MCSALSLRLVAHRELHRSRNVFAIIIIKFTSESSVCNNAFAVVRASKDYKQYKIATSTDYWHYKIATNTDYKQYKIATNKDYKQYKIATSTDY